MWYYNDKEFTSEMIEDYVGFVYEITDTQTGKLYIGKKGLISIKTLPPLKGTKRKRKKKAESDWKTYYGSNETIKEIVANEGPDRFTRKILYLCKGKGEMSYLEMKEQILRDVLLYPDNFYNSFVGGKIHRNHVKTLWK